MKPAPPRTKSKPRSARPVPWTKGEDALLGTVPDERLAGKIGRSVEAVRARRHAKRISIREQWRPAHDQLLGLRPDRQVATRLGWTSSAVGERRRQLGIPSFAEQQQAWLAKKLAAMSDQKIARLLRQSHRLIRRPTASQRTKAPHWTAAEDRLLGKWPDERVARFLGRTRKAAQGRRLKLGIRFASPGRGWTTEEERLLDPRHADGPIKKWTVALARQLGRSVVAVSYHRRLKYGPAFPPGRKWTRRELRLLGTRLDREVAVLVGRTCGNVQTKRCALGIPSCRERQQFHWTPAKDRLLGTLSDEGLAREFGTYRKEVEARRRALGIPGGIQRAWTPEEERLVSTKLSAKEVARRIGRSLKAVWHRRLALRRRPSRTAARANL